MQPIRCVVCEQTDLSAPDSCVIKTSTDVCPSSATHCVSRATYFLSEKSDLHHSKYLVCG